LESAKISSTFEGLFTQLFLAVLALPLMHLNTNVDLQDRSFCDLSYNEAEGWLQAVWHGYVDQQEAQWGANAYLEHVVRRPSAFLLNDNSALQGPWFESLEWLVDVWVPQAKLLGLRYVAHVVQADQQLDVLTARLHGAAPFELQIFQDPADARHWLREVRQLHLEQA
jgi:hypothetical protein